MEQSVIWSALKGGVLLIYVKVPKEIKDYKKKVALGLTTRQAMYLAVGLVVSIVASYFLYPYLGIQGVGIFISLCLSPCIAIGFINIDGIPMEVFLKYYINFITQKQSLSYESFDELYTSRGDEEKNDKSFTEKRKEQKEKRRVQREQEELLEDGSTKATGKKENSTKCNTLSKNVRKWCGTIRR